MFLVKHGFQASLLATAIALTGCGSSSDDKGPGSDGRSGDAFSGLTISAKGGSSELGDGGSGGEVEIYKSNSFTDLTLVKEGNVDTSYTLPEQTPEFGVRAVTITETQTIQLIDSNDPVPAANSLYMVSGQYRLFRSSGEDGTGHESHEVTGLIVEEGAKLFLHANNGSGDVTLYFENDVQNDGIITTVNDTRSSRVDLNLYPEAYYGTGNIELNGSTSNYYRQSGGDLEISARTIINSGLFNTSGANKSDENLTGNGGGNAGSINLNAEVFIENTGELRANGGHSDSDFGTYGGYVYLDAVSIVNTGNINTTAGTGTSSYPASNNAYVELAAEKSIINTGNITATGADAGDSGNAGQGGEIDMYIETYQTYNDIVFDYTLINTGDLNVNGGSILGQSTGDAGNGGDVYIYTYSQGYTNYSPVVFEISGNITADGGNTIEDNADAGHGGDIWIANYDNPTSTSDTFLIGYEQIDVSGGNGQFAGQGGDLTLAFEDRVINQAPPASASVFNNAKLIANGGSTTATDVEPGEVEYQGEGNQAGEIYIEAYNSRAYLVENAISITNEGEIEANGGHSFNLAENNIAQGGEVKFFAADDITINQPISLNGGSDLHNVLPADDDNHEGSNGGSLTINSRYGFATVNTDISLNGGDGDLEGGNGGNLTIVSKDNSTLAGVVELNGGNAIEDEGDTLTTTAGDAGTLFMVAESMGSNVEADITAEPGTGDTAGEDSIIIVDADCLSNNCDSSI